MLNPAAADIWDALIEIGDVDEVARRYARGRPERAELAKADVLTCLDAWAQQGFFRPPEPSPEQRQLTEIDGLRMPRAAEAGFRRSISIAGVAVAVDISDPDLARICSDLLADFPDAPARPRQTLRSTGAENGWVLSHNDIPVRLAETRVAARGQIVAELVRLAGPETGWLATAHGAVLTGPSGAIFLAGASGAGKSTLSAGLVTLGWHLLAEDLAAFDPQVRVAPMPFALSIKDGSLAVLAASYPKLSEAHAHRLGPRRVRYQSLPAHCRATRPETPRLIVDVGFTPDMAPDRATVSRLSPEDALRLFMNEESYVDFAHEQAQGFLDFVANTPAYRIGYATLPVAESAIRERLDAHRAGTGA